MSDVNESEPVYTIDQRRLVSFIRMVREGQVRCGISGRVLHPDHDPELLQQAENEILAGNIEGGKETMRRGLKM